MEPLGGTTLRGEKTGVSKLNLRFRPRDPGIRRRCSLRTVEPSFDLWGQVRPRARELGGLDRPSQGWAAGGERDGRPGARSANNLAPGVLVITFGRLADRPQDPPLEPPCPNPGMRSPPRPPRRRRWR